MKYAPKQERLFESSKLKELDTTIKQNSTQDMNSDELLAHIAYKSLADQRLRNIYWSKETQELADLAIAKAYEESVDKKDLVRAKLERNQAQIIIRDPNHNKFDEAEALLQFALSTFQNFKMEHEILFTEDEILRTKFKRLSRQSANNSKSIDEIHRSWLVLLSRFESFINKNEADTTWYRNSIRHFIEFCACFRQKNNGYARTAIKLFAKDNRKKAIECSLYGLGYIGYLIVVKLENFSKTRRRPN